jgi:hypothetical protein
MLRSCVSWRVPRLSFLPITVIDCLFVCVLVLYWCSDTGQTILIVVSLGDSLQLGSGNPLLSQSLLRCRKNDGEESSAAARTSQEMFLERIRNA